MRWDSLRIDDSPDAIPDPDGAGALPPARVSEPPLFARNAVTRTFDTPGFRGMTFYEIHAKSIVSHVPQASRMPFRWTINPYRGCQHSCRYCQSGDTPILMADGRTRLLADLRVGDQIYGTVKDGFYRHYTVTTVLAHWSTVKPAYRITLEDGTQLIASGDHRFLTERGWKHVTGAEQGPLQRPFLTVNNKLMGMGGFAEGPKDCVDYRRGYLCGMIRGDGHIHDRTYQHPSGHVRNHSQMMHRPETGNPEENRFLVFQPCANHIHRIVSRSVGRKGRMLLRSVLFAVFVIPLFNTVAARVFCRCT